MTKLSDTQTIILPRAARNEDRIAMPLPESLRGGAAAKVVSAMIAKGFLEEVDANMRKDEPVWRETGDGHGVTLVATDAGLAAIGIEPEDANTAPAGATDEPAPDTSAETEAATKPDVAALDWRPHTVRGALAGALKKKLGLEVTSEKVEGRGRVYHLADTK